MSGNLTRASCKYKLSLPTVVLSKESAIFWVLVLHNLGLNPGLSDN